MAAIIEMVRKNSDSLGAPRKVLRVARMRVVTRFSAAGESGRDVAVIAFLGSILNSVTLLAADDLSQPYAGIQPRVHNINEYVHRHYDGPYEKYHALGHRIVAGQKCIDHQMPDSGPTENRFSYHGPANKGGKIHEKQGEYRD